LLNDVETQQQKPVAVAQPAVDLMTQRVAPALGRPAGIDGKGKPAVLDQLPAAAGEGDIVLLCGTFLCTRLLSDYPQLLAKSQSPSQRSTS
jgi:hypothetical protein